MMRIELDAAVNGGNSHTRDIDHSDRVRNINDVHLSTKISGYANWLCELAFRGPAPCMKRSSGSPLDWVARIRVRLWGFTLYSVATVLCVGQGPTGFDNVPEMLVAFSKLTCI